MESADYVVWLKALEVALIASVKFLFAPFEAERQGFTLIQAFIITTLGAMGGILAFTFVGHGIMVAWRKLTGSIRSFFLRKRNRKPAPRRKFTGTTRFIARVRQRFGLAGIAFVTPCIISIPVGTLVATGLYRNKPKILAYMFVSLLFWSLLLNGAAHVIKLSRYL